MMIKNSGHDERDSTMLRGLTTVSFFADDMDAARKWYSELLGIEPYFGRTARVPSRPAAR